MKALTKDQAIKKLKKQFSRKAVVKQLDKVFADYIKARDKRCVQSTKTEPCKAPLTCGHLITRANYSTRWDEGNAFGQCASHNLTHEHHPEYFTTWYIERFGAQSYQLLVAKSKQPSRLKTAELVVLIEYYRQKLKAINE